MVVFEKGTETGYEDESGKKLHVGDLVEFCGALGEVAFECGALGIAFTSDNVPWDAFIELVQCTRPMVLYNDNFISFWEILWNVSDELDTVQIPYVRV